jgi:hypothetical protein
MKAKFLNFGDRRLPSYLGYGILNESSVKSEDDVITAEYYLECDGSTVHQVVWNAKFCEMDTLLHGISCRKSYYPKLEYTLMADFEATDFVKDRVFNFLMQPICKLGNIYVQLPGTGNDHKRAVFFPAGLLMCFKLPVTVKSPAYRDFIEKAASTGYINHFSERKSSMLLCDAGYNITQESITLVDFIVPLAYMTSAAKLFAKSGIIDSRMPYRLMIAESLQAQTASAQIFSGNKSFPLFGFSYIDLSAKEMTALREAFARRTEALKLCIN